MPAARGARLVGEHEVEGVDLAVAGGDGGEVLVEDVGGTALTRAHGGGDVDGCVHHLVMRQSDDRRHPEPPVDGVRCGGEHLVAVEAGELDVVAQHVRQRVRLGHRLDVTQGETVDVGEVVEHVAELRRQAVDLVGRQRQASEPGDVDDLGRGDAIGHGGKPTGEGQNPVWQ